MLEVTRRLALAGTLLALTLSAATASAGTVVKAPVVAKLEVPPPDAPCDFQHRMDVVVINGVWFECSCEALMVGTVCDWYEVTSAAPGADLRKKIRAAKKVTRLKRGVLYTPRVRPGVA